MRSDDFAGLLAQQPPADIGFRQGVVVSWDPVAGANSVNVGGTTLTNLPVLSVNASALVSPGDTVGLLRVRSQYFILGRIVVPGSLSTVAAAGVYGLSDALFDQWPWTQNTTDTELITAIVAKHSQSIAWQARVYVPASSTAVFRVTANGVQLGTSGTLSGDTSGTLSDYTGLVPWPPAVAGLDTVTIGLTGRRVSGTGKVAATLRALYLD